MLSGFFAVSPPRVFLPERKRDFPAQFREVIVPDQGKPFPEANQRLFTDQVGALARNDAEAISDLGLKPG